MLETTPVPTQVLYPWRAALRTAIAAALVIIPIGQAIPEVVEIILTEYGAQADVPTWLRSALLGVSAVATALVGIVTRIMALQGVNEWLTKFNIAAQPKTGVVPPEEVYAGVKSITEEDEAEYVDVSGSEIAPTAYTDTVDSKEFEGLTLS